MTGQEETLRGTLHEALVGADQDRGLEWSPWLGPLEADQEAAQVQTLPQVEEGANQDGALQDDLVDLIKKGKKRGGGKQNLAMI